MTSVTSSALFTLALFAPAAAESASAATSPAKLVSTVSTKDEGEGNGDADSGILALMSPSSSSELLQDRNLGGGLCTQGYVDCFYGNLATDPSKSCQYDADGCYVSHGVYSCCDGDNACFGFTGKICKDGSCNGVNSCRKASIPIVVNSCYGLGSCDKVGYWAPGVTGKVGNFINSCTAYRSCYHVAYGEGGEVGTLTKSCIQEQACEYMGAGQFGPVTSDLNDCCVSPMACSGYSEANIPTQCKVVRYMIVIMLLSNDTSCYLR